MVDDALVAARAGMRDAAAVQDGLLALLRGRVMAPDLVAVVGPIVNNIVDDGTIDAIRDAQRAVDDLWMLAALTARRLLWDPSIFGGYACRLCGQATGLNPTPSVLDSHVVECRSIPDVPL